MQILLVESRTDDADRLERMLCAGSDGATTVDRAASLGHAIARLSTREFDLLLLNLSLPDSSGLDTLRAARRYAPKLPIVALSASLDDQSAVRALQEGAQDHLAKDQLDGKLLHRSIRYAVERQRMLADLERSRQQEHHAATHDALTGLPNRTLLGDRLAKALDEARKNNDHVAVLFLDLDRFKLANDTLGHAVGDRLLKGVAARIAGCVQDCDTVARIGGDEFTVILQGIKSASDAAAVARKILHVLSRPFSLQGYSLVVTASVGISLFPLHGEDAETLVMNADAAMYRAKASGENHFQFYSNSLGARGRERLDLERDMRMALRRREFMLEYQPQLDVVSGRVIGVEALVRWRHPTLGMVSPLQFITVAEETGLIVPLGEWVLHTACRQARLWQDSDLPPLHMAVNFSAVQVRTQGLVETVSSALRDSGINPHLLEMEITESSLMQHGTATTDLLHELRDLGVRISIDDFGTGYSSLSYLKLLPAHKLKIDRAFVKSLTQDSRDRAIAAAIISMARGLDLSSLAEGVETPEQLQVLRDLRCDAVQGYLVSRPVDAARVERLVRTDGRLEFAL